MQTFARAKSQLIRCPVRACVAAFVRNWSLVLNLVLEGEKMSSDSKGRSFRRWTKYIPTGPLSLAEYEHFKSNQARLWMAIGVLFAYVLCFVLLDNARIAFGLAFSEPVLVLAMFPVFICLMVAGFSYKCPRCGATPMAKTFSFTTASFEYGSMVALLPKACGKCGVQFVKPAGEETGETSDSSVSGIPAP